MIEDKTVLIIAYPNSGKTCEEIANSLDIQVEKVERIKNKYEQIDRSIGNKVIDYDLNEIRTL